MPRRTGRKTDYQWTNFGDIAQSNDLAGQGVFGITGSVILAPQTLVRMRGKVGVTLDAAAVDEHAIILCGVQIVTTDNFAGGVASELFTNVADDASWIWQGALYVSSGAESSVDGAFPGLAASVDIDSKAMRKLKVGQTLAFVHQSPTELANDQAGSYDLVYYIHCLIGT